MSEGHTHSEFEIMAAYVSAHEYLIEILVANLWAGLDDAQVQEMKTKILDKAKEPYVSRRRETQPEDVTADFRVAQLIENRCEHILNKAERRLRSHRDG